MERAAPGPLVWSIPNLLTYARILAVPALAGCLFWSRSETAHWVATGIFVVAAVTDFLDGYFARIWGQHSSLGKMLDPIADKLLVSVAILMLVAEDVISGYSLWAAIIILCREILVSGLREYLAELRVSVPVTFLAKLKTTMQLIALSMLIASPATRLYLPYVDETGLVLLWIAAVLTLYTGYDYYRSGIHHAIDGAGKTAGEKP